MESVAIGYATIVYFAFYYRYQGNERLQDLTLLIGNRLLIVFCLIEAIEYFIFYKSEVDYASINVELQEIYDPFFLRFLFLMFIYKCFSLVFVFKFMAKELLLSTIVAICLLLDSPFIDLRPFFDIEYFILTWHADARVLHNAWLSRFTYFHIFAGNTLFVVFWIFLFAYYQLRMNEEGKLDLEEHLIE